MQIPAFAVGNTPSPMTPVEVNQRDQQHALTTLKHETDATERALNAIPQTMIKVGDEISTFAEKIRQQEAVTAGQAAQTQFHVEGTRAAMDWEQALDGPNALGSVVKLKETLQGIKQRIVDAAPSDRAKRHVQTLLDAREGDLLVYGEKAAQTTFKKYASDVADTTIDNYAKSAFIAGQNMDFTALQGVNDHISKEFMAMGKAGIVLSPAESELRNAEANQKAVQLFVHGALSSDRVAMQAIRDVEAGKYNDKLSQKGLEDVVHRAEVKKHQLRAEAQRAQAEARQRAREQAADSMDYLRDQADSAAATGIVNGDVGQHIASLRRMGGAFERRASDMESAIHAGVAIHGTLQKSVFLPFDEQRAAVEQLMPAPGDENFAIKKRAVDMGFAQIDKQERAFTHDPAGFTQQRAARQVMSTGGDPTTPEGFARVATLSTDLQRQMGLPEDKIRLVPLKDAQRMAGAFQRADEDGKLKMLQDLEVYGPQQGQVLAELKIDPSAQHALSLLQTNDPQALNLARSFVSVSSDKVKLTEDEEKQATKDIVNHAAYPALLKAQGAYLAQGGVERNTYADEITKTAARASRLTGDPRKAVQALDAPFTIINDDRIALAALPKQISAKEAVKGFAFLRLNIRDEDFQGLKNSFSQKFGTGVGERAFNEFVSDVRQNAVWVNDGNSFTLIDPRTRLPLALDGGKKMKVSADELQKAARESDRLAQSLAPMTP